MKSLDFRQVGETPSYIWLESSADPVTMVPLTGWGGAIGELHDAATSAGTADRQDAWSACTPCSSNPTNQRRESREVGGDRGSGIEPMLTKCSCKQALGER